MPDYEFVFVDPFLYSWINWVRPFVQNEIDILELRNDFLRRKNYKEVITLLFTKSERPSAYVGALECGGWLRDVEDGIKVSPGFFSHFLKKRYEKRFKNSFFVMVRYNAYIFAALNDSLDFNEVYQYWLLHQTVIKTESKSANVLLVDSMKMFETSEVEIMGYRLSLKLPELKMKKKGLGGKLTMVTNTWFDKKEI